MRFVRLMTSYYLQVTDSSTPYARSIPTRASILFLQLHESTVLAIVQALRFRSASMGESRAANCVNAR